MRSATSRKPRSTSVCARILACAASVCSSCSRSAKMRRRLTWPRSASTRIAHTGGIDWHVVDMQNGSGIDPRQRNLAIEALRNLGGELVLFDRADLIARGFVAAAFPVTGTRQADRPRHAGFELLEMRERGA